MPPKRQKPNAFMLFVMQRKRELEKEGHKFEGTPDAVAKIGPEWEHMSKEERLPFEEEAKKRKEQEKTEVVKKRTEEFDRDMDEIRASVDAMGGKYQGIPG